MKGPNKLITVERWRFEAIIKNKVKEMVDGRIQEELAKQKSVFDKERDELLRSRLEMINKNIHLEKDSDSGDVPRIRRDDEISDSEDWLITYSDIITLILALFVILFALSSIDQGRFEELKAAISKNVSKQEAATPFTQLQQDFVRIFNNYKLGNQVAVNLRPNGIEIELSSNSLYDLGSADIKTEMRPLLNNLALTIKQFDYDNYIVEVEGHTDNIPISTPQFPSNWELSTNRATNIVKYLIAEGIDAERFRVAGYADSRPKLPNVDDRGNSVPAHQAANRRVVIYIKKNDSFVQ